MMGNGLTIPTSDTTGTIIAPLTPPLSDRQSGDVEDFFVPEEEERYENVDLSSEASWEETPRDEIPPTPEEVTSPHRKDIDDRSTPNWLLSLLNLPYLHYGGY